MEVLPEPKKVLDLEPIVDLNYDSVQKEVVKKGVTQRNIEVMPSSNVTNTNITFQNIAPPSLTTVVDRNFRVKYTLVGVVTFPVAGSTAGMYPIPPAVVGQGVERAYPNGAAAYVAGQSAIDPETNGVGGGGVGELNYTMALRAFPLNSSLANCDLKLNGGATTLASNDLVCIKPYLIEDSEIRYFECPVQRDDGAQYTSNSNNDNRNPFNSFRQNTAYPTRGSYLATLVYENVAGGNVTRVYQWEITESIIISPLVWGKSFDDEGFANLVNISINLRIQDIQRSISLCSGLVENSSVQMSIAPITVAGTEFGKNTCDLLLNYCDQDPIFAARQPSTLYYNWDLVQIDANSNAVSGALTNASPDKNFNSNALRLSTIPDKIYFYLKPTKGQLLGAAAQTITDTFLRIMHLTVQFGSDPNLLTSFEEEDLWRMSCKNGLNMSFHEWKYTNGSIAIIDIASDLGLKSDEAAGASKYNQIKVSGTYSCTPLAYAGQATAVLYDAVTVVITGGEAVISPNKCQFTNQSIDSSQVLALTTMSDNTIQASGFRRLHGTRGGSLLHHAGKYLHKGLKFLLDNKDHVHKGLEMAHSAVKHMTGGEMVGGDMAGGSVVAGKLVKYKDGKHKRT